MWPFKKHSNLLHIKGDKNRSTVDADEITMVVLEGTKIEYFFRNSGLREFRAIECDTVKTAEATYDAIVNAMKK
jgi:shikimate kinase